MTTTDLRADVTTTWHGESRPSGPGHAAPSFRAEETPSRLEQRVDPAELFTRCVRLWGALIGPDALREVKYAEQGLKPCDSCQLRSGTIVDAPFTVCAPCYNAGNRR